MYETLFVRFVSGRLRHLLPDKSLNRYPTMTTNSALAELLAAVTSKAAPDTTAPIAWSGSPTQNQRMYAAIDKARKAIANDEKKEDAFQTMLEALKRIKDIGSTELRHTHLRSGKSAPHQVALIAAEAIAKAEIIK